MILEGKQKNTSGTTGILTTLTTIEDHCNIVRGDSH